MKEAEQVRDDRLAPWPKVFRQGDEMRLKFRVLTPLRLSVVNELLIAPLIAVWQVLAGAFLIAVALEAFEWAYLFPYLPVSRTVLAVSLGVPLILWAIERFGGYPVCRMLVGRTVTVKITLASVSVRKGLFSFSRQFSRAQRIVFVHENFEYPRLPIYSRSEFWSIVIGDIRKERLLEVYNTEQIAALVTNLNVALMLLSHQKTDNFEDDPTEARMLRLRREES